MELLQYCVVAQLMRHFTFHGSGGGGGRTRCVSHTHLGAKSNQFRRLAVS